MPPARVSRSAAAGGSAQLTGLAVRDARVAGAQHGYQHLMITLADGRRAFAKAVAPGAVDDLTAADRAEAADRDEAPGTSARSDAVAAAFAAEANGLRWLAEAVAVPVPEVLAVGPQALVISMIPPGRPTPEAAFGFGADLARLHAAGAAGFGAPWPGFIASLPLDNTPLPDAAGDWPQWYAQRRLLPFLRRAVDAGALGPDDARLVEAVIDRIGSLAGPPSRRAASTATAGPGTCCGPAGGAGSSTRPPTAATVRPTWPCWPCSARLAWTGSWRATTRRSRWPAGWRSRIPLHQLHPLLVHACLFGASYRDEVRSAARAVLRCSQLLTAGNSLAVTGLRRATVRPPPPASGALLPRQSHAQLAAASGPCSPSRQRRRPGSAASSVIS